MHSDFLASGNKHGANFESSHDIFILYHHNVFLRLYKHRLEINVEICETNATSSKAQFLQSKISTNCFIYFRTSNMFFDNHRN